MARESNASGQGNLERKTRNVGIADLEAADSLDGDVSLFPHGDRGLWIHVLVTVGISRHAPHNQHSNWIPHRVLRYLLDDRDVDRGRELRQKERALLPRRSERIAYRDRLCGRRTDHTANSSCR